MSMRAAAQRKSCPRRCLLRCCSGMASSRATLLRALIALASLAAIDAFHDEGLAESNRVEFLSLAAEDECESSDCALSALQLRAKLTKRASHDGHGTSEISAMRAPPGPLCTGDGELPTGIPACYQGTFLTETLTVKVESESYSPGDGESKISVGIGKVDVFAQGLKAGSCIGAAFNKSSRMLSTEGIPNCFLDGFEYTASYCSSTDSMLFSFVTPLPFNVELKKIECAAELALTDERSTPDQDRARALLQSPPEVVTCTGDGNWPTTLPLCYRGSLLVESLEWTVLSYTAGDSAGVGKVNMVAKGPQEAICNGAAFEKSGQLITIEDASNCGLTGFEYSVRYCSTQDRIMVNVTQPFAIMVALDGAACSAEIFEPTPSPVDPFPPSYNPDAPAFNPNLPAHNP
ncbi:unnamed protein product [Polarella glacialis]|uniref:Uncharacterized protein n=1 Tax=Polarella glacialis TaxID=89957 RepID=A0A813KY04_POLGL|nr:unnamed protein product [Polarella glacialis]